MTSSTFKANVRLFDYALFKNAVVQFGCGKFVAKLFVKVLENTTIRGLHGSEILG
jgi:hypothetical protein